MTTPRWEAGQIALATCVYNACSRMRQQIWPVHLLVTSLTDVLKGPLARCAADAA